MDKSFSDLYDFIERGANSPISISFEEMNNSIKNEYIDLLWKKIYSRKAFDKEGAITACKTMIETSLKHLLDEANIGHSAKDSINDLYAKVSHNYDLDPKKQKQMEFRKLCSGYITIINSITAIRNLYGDAHGKSSRSIFYLQQNYIDLVINMTGTVVTFLLSLSNKKVESN